MTKSIEAAEQVQRRHDHFIASSKLEGITLSDRQAAMFDLFSQRQWCAEQCVRYVEEYLRDHCL